MQNVFRTTEGRRGVDAPVLPEELPEKLGKHPRFCQDFQQAMQLQFISAWQVFRRSVNLSRNTLLRTASSGFRTLMRCSD